MKLREFPTGERIAKINEPNWRGTVVREMFDTTPLCGVAWDYAPWRNLQYQEEDDLFEKARIGPLPFMPQEFE